MTDIKLLTPDELADQWRAAQEEGTFMVEMCADAIRKG